MVYFTWLPDATLGVDLVKPEVWLYSTEPVDKIGHFLALACTVKELFMPGLPNVPHDHDDGGHGKPPYYTLDETVGRNGHER